HVATVENTDGLARCTAANMVAFGRALKSFLGRTAHDIFQRNARPSYHERPWHHCRRRPAAGPVVVIPGICPDHGAAFDRAGQRATVRRPEPGGLACSHGARSLAKEGLLPSRVSENRVAGSSVRRAVAAPEPARAK